MIITIYVLFNYNKNESSRMEEGHTFHKKVNFVCIDRKLISITYLQNVDMNQSLINSSHISDDSERGVEEFIECLYHYQTLFRILVGYN